MRSLYLTLMIFVQVLLASFILYSRLASGSPIEPVPHGQQAAAVPQPAHKQPDQHQKVAPLVHHADQATIQKPQARSSAPVVSKPVVAQHAEAAKVPLDVHQKDSPVVINHRESPTVEKKVSSPVKAAPVVQAAPKEEQVHKAALVEQTKKLEHSPEVTPVVQPYYDSERKLEAQPETAKVVAAIRVEAPTESVARKEVSPVQAVEVMKVEHSVPSVQAQHTSRVGGPMPPVVNGGLGPLHLLATTLCSYQPDKPVADESQNLLYARRAAVRKSLFEFMSLKFTNLEKFSSRLNPGLEVVPPKTIDPSQAVPSHGWPVVGKCTAHDLKLMAEAAWCECAEEATCGKQQQVASTQSTEELDKQVPTITSNHHNRAGLARSLPQEQAISADKSAIISKILHVSDVKDAPVVESTIASLNLTQQQLASIQAQVTSTRECRKNALRMTKALLNHLAEDQRVESDSWPKLYAQMAADECARKRMIDIVSALSGYRTEASSIRRDNVEFAFAMDDLRSKVLESEVNAPLTFDKQFIEVGQFLQQSVKLMLTNIDPARAKLTSMRYRSLMPGPVSADDQCIELHQRLLAKNYPTDCNPTQFGQLPDVLRMAASSLELWSIESELSKYAPTKSSAAQQHEYPCAAQQIKLDLNECISNLVRY